jgi:RNA polymerase sigma-70 factor (ECF subfamily)
MTAPADTDLMACVRELPPMQQAVVALRFGNDLALADIGRALGKRRAAVESLQRRALARLRGMLEETIDEH